MNTDIEIARKAVIKPISKIAENLGIDTDVLEFYDKYKAKLPSSLIDNSCIHNSRLVLVSAIFQTLAIEGKAITLIGLLSQGLNKNRKENYSCSSRAALVSLFGVKKYMDCFKI